MLFNQVHHADASLFLKNLDENSIDTLLTDPPYALTSGQYHDNHKGGFMNKAWDAKLVSVDTWKECLRVLKPGSFAAIMSSPRQDVLSRMICNLQDAGFRTDFTSIYWTYACLSEDTEVLTEDGWERFNKSNRFINKQILCYDIVNDQYFFEKPLLWNTYFVKEQLYRIKSDDQTDQLVSRNHRVFTTKGFIQAERLQEQESIAYLSELPKRVLHLSRMAKDRITWSLLFNKLQTESKHKKISSNQWKACSFDVRRKETNTERINDGGQELGLEGGSNLFQNSWQLHRSEIYPMSKGISLYGKEGWLCNGASDTSSSTNWQTIIEDRGCSSHRPYTSEQQLEQSHAFCEQSTSQEVRAFSKSYKTTVATVTREYYEGLIFCPTVSSGCFIARRNGKIFITGNSGFPKAANVSKLVDKRAGAEREVIGSYKHPRSVEQGKEIDNSWGDKSLDGSRNNDIYGLDERNRKTAFSLTAAATEKAQELDGGFCGFQPKPAVEVILMVMKPLSEKTYVDQALANGKGITWLDACRIPFQDDKDTATAKVRHDGKPVFNGKIYNNGKALSEYLRVQEINTKGRFPANLVVENDILNDGKITKSVGGSTTRTKENKVGNWGHGDFKMQGYGDTGSYSRYFSLDAWFDTTFPFIITPKASSSERNKGLESLEKKQMRPEDGSWKSLDIFSNRYTENTDNPTGRGKTPLHQNIHPTCKPIKLMAWLVTLLSRPNDIVLDPFCGSGTTCIAAKLLKRQYIGIEINEEYAEIARQRINTTIF